MQLLIFLKLPDREVCCLNPLSPIDSLNIISFTKKNVKHFFKNFSIFFNFFYFLRKSKEIYLSFPFFRFSKSLLYLIVYYI